MAMSPYLARLRAVIGHELIQMPSVSVVVVDDDARILLVRHAGHHDGWAVPGGAVDVGESPVEAAVREIREEISELRWFAPDELPGVQLSRFTKALLRATGHLAG
ncbi:NUDIX domain-containing protein [Micromonospora sediminicola]|uniref:NUDIX domain-containing protein n=1 Tax=Micromonospora sediminicola TaxID=946078 RepID=UPI0033BA43EB